VSNGKITTCVDSKPHNFVDKVIQFGGWPVSKRMVIYCTKCGSVTYDHYM
jgi:hypothetical protein